MKSINSVERRPEYATVTALAALLGTDKGFVSRKVSKFEAQGLLTTRSEGVGRGRAKKLVPVAAYLAADEQSADAIQAANSAARFGKDPTLSNEQARRVKIYADIAQIKLDKERGDLVSTVEVRESMARAGGELVRGLETMKTKVPEIAACVAKDGEAGLRVWVNGFIREMRERLAGTMTVLGAGGEE